MTNRLATAAVAVLLLSGCSTPSPEYRPRVPGGLVGFSQMQLSPNRYLVSFYGGSASTREVVENHLAQRAAEVTLNAGYTHFVVDMRNTERDLRRRPDFVGDTYLHGPDYYNRARRWSNIPLAAEGVEAHYSAEAEIALLRPDEVPGNGTAISALDVIQRLQPSPPLAIASATP